ncbi:MAG: sensor histidine kinase [Candidatus Promineifilaceae bacterium]
MFSSLRSRLLLSYVAVIATALLVVTLALLAVSVGQANRILPTLRQLSVIGQATRRELAQQAAAGLDGLGLAQTLNEIAAVQDVRIVLVNASTSRVLYDSSPAEANWVGSSIGRVDRPSREFRDLDPTLPVGRYQAPDGSRWLVYGQPLANRPVGRLVILFARPEPRILQYFRETFLRPLFWAGLLALLLSVLLAILITRSVARPLQEMATAAESIAQGDYSQQLPLRGPQEVQRVATSFNTMARQVSATQQAQRDFVANVSHDLKTPLTAISGWSQAIYDGTAVSPEEQRRAAGIIHGEAERMGRLVTQLLDLARLESGQLQVGNELVELARLLGDISHNLSPRAQAKGVDFSLDLQPTPPIMGDPDRLAQVFTNLLDNAVEHSPPGAQVRIGLRLRDWQTAEIAVQDNGPGIPPEELGRIFERFYQLDRSRARSEARPGSGLGLAIAKGLVEAHGGSITVESQVGRGSTFLVALPAVAQRST